MAFAIILSGCCRKQCEVETMVTLAINFSTDDYCHYSRSESESKALTICIEGKNYRETYHIAANGNNIKVPLRLSPNRYNVHVWMDECSNCRESSLLPYISVKSPERYSPTCDGKGGSIDLVVGTKSSEHIIELERPLAKIRFVTEDLSYNTPRSLTATIVYSGYFPSMFNVSSFKPCDAQTGYSFSLPVTSDLLGEDHIFCDDYESFVMVNIIVKDSNNKLVAESRNIKVLYRKGYTTTVTGDFLTSNTPGSGGISIDTEWEGKYEVEF